MSQLNDGTLHPVVTPATDVRDGMRQEFILSGDMAGAQYENVAASQSAQVCGPTGAVGDYLSHVVVAPASTSPGVVTILDGATQFQGSFAGGASSVSNLIPFLIPVGAKSVSGAWKITTGASVSCAGVGSFT